MKLNFSVVCVAGLFSSLCVSSQAAVQANFTDGAGNGSVDAYVGTAGGGWSTAWGSVGNATGTVSSAAPINGGGNYLNVISTSTTTSAAGSVGRRYSGSGSGFNLSSIQTISWQFRVNETIGSSFSTGNDRYQFFGDSSLLTTTAVSNEWFVFASGATPASALGNFTAGNWTFFSGDTASTGFGVATLYDSGIAMVAGTIYSFTIVTDPSTKTYIGTVSDGTNSYTSPTLNWRNYSTAGSTSGGYFNAGANTSTANEIRDFSIDNISIVPEPGSAVLLMGGSLMLGLRRRRA